MAGDTVVIDSGHTVVVSDQAGGALLNQCAKLTVQHSAALTLSVPASNLLVSGPTAVSTASRLTVTDGLLTLTGGLALGGGSVLRTQAGATSILGVVSVDALLFGGQTAIQVDGGTFTCVGNLNLLGGFGVADLRIGQALVNVYGLLTASPTNATLRFTSAGTLTLGGIIFFPTPANFTAGAGTVVYAGVPGTVQQVSPFTY